MSQPGTGHPGADPRRAGRSGGIGGLRILAAALAVMASLAGCGSAPYPPAAATGKTGARAAVAATGPGALLRADVQVIFFPPRSAAEYLDPAAVRSVTVSATGGTHDTSRIITSRAGIARLAGLLDGAHAMPMGAMPAGCPAEFFPLPRLTFTPVSASRPVVVVDPTNCLFDNVSADGARQPALVDTGLFSITERLLPPASREAP